MKPEPAPDMKCELCHSDMEKTTDNDICIIYKCTKCSYAKRIMNER